MDCSYSPGFNVNDMFMCFMATTGIPFDLIALVIIVGFIVFAMISRLDFDISLAFAIALIWALMVISGGSIMLSWMMGLLMLGFGLRILIGILGIFRQ